MVSDQQKRETQKYKQYQQKYQEQYKQENKEKLRIYQRQYRLKNGAVPREMNYSLCKRYDEPKELPKVKFGHFSFNL